MRMERYALSRWYRANRAALIDLLKPILASYPTQHWITLLESANVPCGPINRIDEVFADPQVVARAMRVELDDPRAGRVPLVANPIRFAGSPVTYRRAPPRIGEHTDEVLTEWLGLDDGEIASLRAQRAV